MKISTNTVRGAILPITVTSGCPVPSGWVGRLIATDTGSGSARGARPGLKTSPGDTLHSTMAAGFITTIIGDGRLAQSMFARTTLQRWSPGSVARDGA